MTSSPADRPALANILPESCGKGLRVWPIDLKQTEILVSDPSTDLFTTIPHGTGQTILREVLLVADHNAYHLGVLVVTDRILKTKS